MLIYDSDTRGRERDGSSQGALLATNRAQKAPTTRKEAPADACVAFGRKISATWPDWALDFSQRPLKAQLVYCIAQRPSIIATSSSCQPHYWLGRCQTFTQRCASARAATQKGNSSLKSCRSDATPRARASHIARARCGNAPARAAARKSAYTHNFTDRLQPTHTTKPRRPSSTRSRATTFTIRR